MEISRESLIQLLQRQGYSRTDTVADAGEFAVRGSIFDIYPSGLEQGLRLDFFGDELETLRLFDTGSQRSVGTVDQHLLLPASEALLDEDSVKRFRSRYREQFGANATSDPLYQAVSDGRRLAGMEHWLPLFEDRMVTLFDHLAADDLMVIDSGALGAGEERLTDIADYFASRSETSGKSAGSYRPLDPDALYLTRAELDAQLAGWPVHKADIFAQPESAGVDRLRLRRRPRFRARTRRRADGENVYEAAAKHLHAVARSGPQGHSRRLFRRQPRAHRLDPGRGGRPRPACWPRPGRKRWASPRRASPPRWCCRSKAASPMPRSNCSPSRTCLATGWCGARSKRKDADAFLAELSALTPGDLVVHMDHGIGRYEGLQSIPVGKSPHDCVMLSYAGGDKLYMPVENIDVLSRFGSGSEVVPLDRLGGEAWQRRHAEPEGTHPRDRARIAAHRGGTRTAHRAGAGGGTGQLRPVRRRLPLAGNRGPGTRHRAGSGRSWRRQTDGPAGLRRCRLRQDRGGDARRFRRRNGRAAGRAGRARPRCSPASTTPGLSQRFAGLPAQCRAAFAAGARQARPRATKEGLTEGTMDIVIGTHALLSKSVKFKRLGLVIVDEEQHFGVTHKEKLKQLRADVHVLTLTATPIPRTLQMAMSGLRELSTIQTPPVDRLAVRTYVMEWDHMVMREALLREHHRGGQSFIVVPRIADMPDLEEWLRKTVPEVKSVSAHGQMSPGEVEERMSAFYEGKYDVLLSTTIVEAAWIFPAANTIIIHRADRFGLAQLYQLRGRVGRSKLRAYAYLTTPADTALTEIAQKRLKVLGDLDSLGAGFQLASHDLDIRGAGNLLGDEQSGHIREVGFELYQSMLEDAILAAKAGDMGLEREISALSPQITVDAPIMIPEEYVPDLAVRMALYRRLNDAKDAGEIDGLAAEMIDRFGPLPDATANLVKLIEIKHQAIEAHIAKIDVGAKGSLVSFHNDSFPDPMGLVSYAQRLEGTIRLRPDNKIVITRVWGDPKSRLNGLYQLTKGLSAIARKARR